MMELSSKQKANIAELAVAADLAKRGFTVAIAYGEYGEWDLLVDRHIKPVLTTRQFERVQVKYATKTKGYIPVRNRCHSVTAGRVQKTTLYNESVEWVAVYEPTTDACYYIPAAWLGGEEMRLRIDAPKNGQVEGVRWAKDYVDMIRPDPHQQIGELAQPG